MKHEAMGVPLPEWRRAYYPQAAGPAGPAVAAQGGGNGSWPYGRPGYGAPLRDVDGNVVTGFTHAVSRSPAAEVWPPTSSGEMPNFRVSLEPNVAQNTLLCPYLLQNESTRSVKPEAGRSYLADLRTQ